MDRFHFNVLSFSPAIVRQQVLLGGDNKALKFILLFEVKVFQYVLRVHVYIKTSESLRLLFMLNFLCNKFSWVSLLTKIF